MGRESDINKNDLESREKNCSQITKSKDCKENTLCMWKKDNSIKYKGSEFNKDYKNMDIGELVKLLKKANDKYFNSTPIMTDNEYDILKNHLEDIAPDHPILKEIGAPIKGSKKKVTLPYFMPSLDKVKHNTLEKWLKKYKDKYVVSEKLDGVSALFCQKNNTKNLYTRGNGSIGQDISNLIPFIENLKNISSSDTIVRGELIISNNDFENNFDKSNARNTVSGLVTSKTIQKKQMKFVKFIVYEVIEPILIPSKQFIHAKNNNFEVVKYEIKSSIDLMYASQTLIEWRQNSNYKIDGIIITNDYLYERKNENPKHSVAFKMVLEDQSKEAIVTGITWKASKYKLLKPVVHIEQINIGGVKVSNISGQNASFIEKNSIGKGAIIEVVRRGDVIPYIEKIIKKAKSPDMPDGNWEWTLTHVDIKL